MRFFPVVYNYSYLDPEILVRCFNSASEAEYERDLNCIMEQCQDLRLIHKNVPASCINRLYPNFLYDSFLWCRWIGK